MTYLAYILIFAAVIYIVFAVLPAITAGLVIFSRQKRFYGEDEYNFINSYYEKYENEIISAKSYLLSKHHDKISIISSDNTKLYCDYYNNGNSDNLVVFFHGYRADPYLNFAKQAMILHDCGYNIALVYQRSHSNLPGKHTGLGSIEKYDVIDWINYFNSNGDNKYCLAYGTSMGCVSLGLACDKLPCEFVKGIVLDCGFLSAYEQIKYDSIKRHLPYKLLMPYISLAAKLILKADIRDNVSDHIINCHIPKLFIHGKADSTVDYHNTVNLYEICKSKKDILLVENAEHTVSIMEGMPYSEKKLTDFFNNCLNQEETHWEK